MHFIKGGDPFWDKESPLVATAAVQMCFSLWENCHWTALDLGKMGGKQ